MNLNPSGVMLIYLHSSMTLIKRNGVMMANQYWNIGNTQGILRILLAELQMQDEECFQAVLRSCKWQFALSTSHRKKVRNLFGLIAISGKIIRLEIAQKILALIDENDEIKPIRFDNLEEILEEDYPFAISALEVNNKN